MCIKSIKKANIEICPSEVGKGGQKEKILMMFELFFCITLRLILADVSAAGACNSVVWILGNSGIDCNTTCGSYNSFSKCSPGSGIYAWPMTGKNMSTIVSITYDIQSNNLIGSNFCSTQFSSLYAEPDYYSGTCYYGGTPSCSVSDASGYRRFCPCSNCLPTTIPSNSPSKPSKIPSASPTAHPSASPTLRTSTVSPSSILPTIFPSLIKPTAFPSTTSTCSPSCSPSSIPTSTPTCSPSSIPTSTPSCSPSSIPTSTPSCSPSSIPTSTPSCSPSSIHTSTPSCSPSSISTSTPSAIPTNLPSTNVPSLFPILPTMRPTSFPTYSPTSLPSTTPTSHPTTTLPSIEPTMMPTSDPSNAPSLKEISLPSRTTETISPTEIPSATIRPSIIPSVEPSSRVPATPTEIPSRLPTVHISFSPSSYPSTEPLEAPTTSPSIVIPSCSPTTLPTSLPIASPTEVPSILPTSITPTLAPTITPSILSTSSPTSTLNPSCKITACPTYSPPSEEPFSLPSSFIPSTYVTKIPSMIPTNSPSLLPLTVLPSFLPSDIPSIDSPSAPPSCQPSTLPSSTSYSPTGVGPTIPHTTAPISWDVPTRPPSAVSDSTFYPSPFPSSPPVLLPVSTPKISNMPTFAPSTITNSPTIATTTVVPTPSTSNIPTSAVPTIISSRTFFPSPYSLLPSMMPTKLEILITTSPSSLNQYCPSFSPTRESSKSARPSFYPVGDSSTLPSAFPSNIPSNIPSPPPTTFQTVSPSLSSHPSFSPSRNPSQPMLLSNHTLAAPIILFMRLNSTSSSVHVRIQLSGSGSISCAAFPSTFLIRTLDDISLVALSKTVMNESSLSVTGLNPLTAYRVYCYTSRQSAVSSLLEVQQSSQLINTTCCKTITVAKTASVAVASKITLNLLSLKISALPINSLTLKLMSNSSISDLFSPSSYTISNNDGLASLQLSSSLSALPTGNYFYWIVLSGPSAAEYSINYPNTNLKGDSIRVLNANDEPPAPTLTNARFSDDGTSITITFSGNTDKGGTQTLFPCNQLFVFSCANISRCQWTDNQNVLAYVNGGSSCASPGNLLYFSKVAAIKAMCQSANGICPSHSQWMNVSSNGVVIQEPSNPPIPNVIITAPTIISACDNLTLDTSSSTGNGGRAWKSISITVEGNTQSSAAQIQSYLQNYGYSSSPPTIPYHLITKGFEYRFDVKLCNFLGFCNEAFQIVSAIDSYLPVVVIPGGAIRTNARSSLLTLGSIVSLSRCSSLTSHAPLSYQWNILTNNYSTSGMKSISKDSSTFILPPYSLQVKTFYTIQLSVNVVGHSKVASYSTTVYVTVGNIFSVVTGGLYRSVNVGSTISLDASQSYDEDIYGLTGTRAGLNFSWKCSQISPSLNESCNTFLRSTFTASSATITALSAALGSSFQIIVSVADSTNERSSQSIVIVKVVTAKSTIVTLTANSITGIVNPSQNLQLTGSLSVSDTTNTTAIWSVDDLSIDLSRIAFSRTRVRLTALQSTIYLVLPPFSLTGGMRPTFALSCRSAADSEAAVAYFSIDINSPPRPGYFEINPTSGVELETVFTFSAYLWIDSQLPLSYHFGYVTGSSVYVTLQSRSLSSFGASQLPAGSSTTFLLSTFLQVFDNLDANTSSIIRVPVSEGNSISSPSSIQAYFTSLVNTSRTVDDTKKGNAFATYLLNKVNCSLAPNCSSLNRQECYKTPNTCGRCYSGFVGDSGDDNSPCHSPAQLGNLTAVGLKCKSSSCSAFQSCVSGQCKNILKSCPSNCSNHGRCGYVEADSGQTIAQCFIGDSTCDALCVCDSDFRGISCGISAAEFSIKQSIRNHVVQNIYQLLTTEYPSNEAAIGWIASLVDATQLAEELSAQSIRSVLNISSLILRTAESLQLSNTDLSTLLSAINSATKQTSSGRNISSLSSLNASLSNLQLYSNLIAKSILPGQNAVQSVQTEFRLAVASLVGDSSLSVPTDAFENLNGQMASSIHLNSTKGTSISIVMMRSGLFNNSLYKSNPVFTGLSHWPYPSDVSEIHFVLQNSLPQLFDNRSIEHYNLTCHKSLPYVASHSCRSGRVVHVNCSGEASVVHGHCPPVTTRPSCKVLDGELFVTCMLAQFSSTTTTCRCILNRKLSSSRKLMIDPNDNSTFHLNIVSMLETVIDNAESTILSAQGLNGDEISKEWTVLAVLCSLTFIAFALMLLGHIYDLKESQKITSEIFASKAVLSKGMLFDTKRRGDRFEKVLNAPSQGKPLLEEALPQVFISEKSFYEKIRNEIVNHHRWIAVFCRYSETFPRSLRVLSLATNIIVMLFIQSITYNLSNPDDGTCGTYTTSASCTQLKSSFSNGANKCKWTPASSGSSSGSCSFIEPSDSVSIVLFVAMFSAVVSVPIAVFLHALIQSVLSAPVLNRELGEPVTRKSLKLPVDRSLQSERDLDKLLESISEYRETLCGSTLAEFDELWGLNHDGRVVNHNGMNLIFSSVVHILIPSSGVKSVYDNLLNELDEVNRQVSVELDELGFDKLSNREKAKRLMYLFQCDLLPGLSGQILNSKSSREATVKGSVSLPMKLLGYGTVLLANAGMLFYIFLFALQQSKTRQSAWLQSFLIWLLCEVFFVSTIVVLVVHYFIPNMIRDDVSKIGEKLRETLSEYHRDFTKGGKDSSNVENQSFNSAEYLFVSTKLAKQVADLPVARAITHFRTTFPRRSYQHVSDASDSYRHSGMAFFFRSFGTIILFMIGNYMSLPGGMQDGIIHGISALGIGYLTLLHAKLYDIFPALAFLPLFVVVLLVHFYCVAKPLKHNKNQQKSFAVQPIPDDSSCEEMVQAEPVVPDDVLLDEDSSYDSVLSESSSDEVRVSKDSSKEGDFPVAISNSLVSELVSETDSSAFDVSLSDNGSSDNEK